MKAFVKISGDLIRRQDVIEWLILTAKQYDLTICTGGGTQINDEFHRRGFAIKYGPLGRETANEEQRKLALQLLEKNRRDVETLITQRGLKATITTPAITIGHVTCPVNGDTMALAAYLGFERCYVLTLHSRLAAKTLRFVKYPRIVVVGFPDQHNTPDAEISDSEWETIIDVFRDSGHMHVLVALKSANGTPASIDAMSQQGHSNTGSARWNISRINQQLRKLSLPFTIRLVQRRSVNDSGTAKLFRMAR